MAEEEKTEETKACFEFGEKKVCEKCECKKEECKCDEKKPDCECKKETCTCEMELDEEKKEVPDRSDLK